MNRQLLTGIFIVLILGSIGAVSYGMLAGRDKDASDRTTNTNATHSNTNGRMYPVNDNANVDKDTNSNTNANTNAVVQIIDEEFAEVEEEKKTTNSNSNTNTNDSSSSGDNTKAYTNERYGFSVDVPEGWIFMEETSSLGYYLFGEEEMMDEKGYEGEWSISVYNQSTKKLDELIAAIGDQYEDRKEVSQEVTLGDLEATKYTITTPSNSAWHYEAVVIDHNGRWFIIANGATQYDEFEPFYKSFSFGG